MQRPSPRWSESFQLRVSGLPAVGSTQSAGSCWARVSVSSQRYSAILTFGVGAIARPGSKAFRAASTSSSCMPGYSLRCVSRNLLRRQRSSSGANVVPMYNRESVIRIRPARGLGGSRSVANARLAWQWNGLTAARDRPHARGARIGIPVRSCAPIGGQLRTFGQRANANAIGLLRLSRKLKLGVLAGIAQEYPGREDSDASTDRLGCGGRAGSTAPTGPRATLRSDYDGS